MSISSWFNGSKTYPITQDRKEIHTLYKKRIKDNELIEIGYQTKDGWVLHEPDPTPKFVAEWFEKKGGLHLMSSDTSLRRNSYYPGTYLKSGIEIVVNDFPQELYKNQNEVVGFVLDDSYVYYDDFEHPTTTKEYVL